MMRKPRGIIIFGANGCGKTTLGRELARVLNFKHMDIEDYIFKESEIPYTNARPQVEYLKLMLDDIEKYRSFVICAVTGDFGEVIPQMYDLAVFLSAPDDTRIKRVEQRAYAQHGERIREGNDMYEQHLQFIEFVTNRPLSKIEQWAQTLTCPVIRVDGTEDYRQIADGIANRFYTKPGEPWRASVSPLGELEKYRFTVIFARHNGKWLYARHKERDTYETAGGHIEPNETTLECAKRELYEETGAEKYDITPAFDYSVHRDTEFSYGQVFYADIEVLGELPDSEMAEVCILQTLPNRITYPAVLPVLYEEMQKWLNLQSAKDEMWDIYDSERNHKGRTHRRADPLPADDYHLVVHVWLQNSNGEYLITKRAPNKGYPNMWECTGGSAIAGDDSITAAVREVKEETGLDAKPENGICVYTLTRDDSICDVWLFRQDFDIRNVVLQDNETTDAKYATPDSIRRMIANGEFIAFHYINDLFEKVKDLA